MDSSSGGKNPNSSFSIRYNANNEELEEVFSCDDDPPTPQTDASPSQSITVSSENASPKRLERSGSIIDKYFKSMRPEKVPDEKQNEAKDKIAEEKSVSQKDVNASPMKEYLNRFGKRKEHDVNVGGDGKDGSNETWKIFQDFKVKIAQAVEEIKSSRTGDDKEKSVPRDSSVSDSEENSAVRDVDQQSVGDTDNQVSSLHSSIHNLSELTQPVTAKATTEPSRKRSKSVSESSDDTQKLDRDEMNEVFPDDNLHDIESGVEAFEESNLDSVENEPHEAIETSSEKMVFPEPNYLKSSIILTPSKEKLVSLDKKRKKYIFSVPMAVFTLIVFCIYLTSPLLTMNGFLLGVWSLWFGNSLKCWLFECVNDTEDENSQYFKEKKRTAVQNISYIIPPIKEHKPVKKYEGWVNHYRYSEYDPFIYNINKTTSAFMKLEDCNLRISYSRCKVSKKASWDEKLENISFYQHQLYSLVGARIILLPKGLVSKRLWSKKYPLCIILSEKEKIQVLEKENREKELSPDKTSKREEAEQSDLPADTRHRKKFIWRRRDKDTADPIGKPGLRHRFVRKIHKDKKSDDASTSTDPSLVGEKVTTDSDEVVSPCNLTTKAKDEIVLDDDMMANEELKQYVKIKEIIDETEELELAAATSPDMSEPSEWSLHTREKEVCHPLYIFARTSRDKHEWYRRIRAAILEANRSEASEDNLCDSAESDNVFRVADKDAVAFSKIPGSAYNMAPEPITVRWAEETLRTMDMKAHEREFWPYMYKIIEAHRKEMTSKSSVGVPCSVQGLSKPKRRWKKLTSSNRTAGEGGGGGAESGGEARAGAGDAGWLNAVVSRLAYDAMRNPEFVARIQKRIQRKLNTLKLPSVVRGLVATELSLGCVPPRVLAVAGPACDERGVWIDADVRYDGGAYITLNTNINLVKLDERDEELERPGEEDEQDPDSPRQETSSTCHSPLACKKKSAIYDSEVDDSAESSSDEDSSNLVETVPLDGKYPTTPENSANPRNSADGSSGAKKFLRMVDKITESKYFKQFSDYKMVKRAMENLSNTDIKLHLELKGLEGRLAINMPPPPHDRVWIGFRSNPRIWLKARPALGTRAVRISHITNWIEQKLCKEFEKVLVLPNMEDITLDLLTPTPVDFE